MHHSDHERTIVVGYDGSKGSQMALDWAVHEATLRGADLCVLRVWSYPDYGTFDEQWDIAQERLENELKDVLVSTGDLRWQAVALKGSPAKVLVEHSADAELLVVGSRGRGGFTGLLLGSVGHGVSAHARVPVVIVKRH